MTFTYVEPDEMLAGADVYPRHWNRLVENQKNINARLEIIEGLEPPEPDFSSFPIGGIVAFSLPAASIPAGWQVCDGTNGTPDLRTAFIYGASIDGDVGNNGGAATHVHTNPNTSNAGGHSHTLSGNTSTPSATAGGGSGGNAVASSGHTHGVNLNTNGGGSHSHTVGNTAAGSSLPPYIKLYWIMRLS